MIHLIETLRIDVHKENMFEKGQRLFMNESIYCPMQMDVYH